MSRLCSRRFALSLCGIIAPAAVFAALLPLRGLYAKAPEAGSMLIGMATAGDPKKAIVSVAGGYATRLGWQKDEAVYPQFTSGKRFTLYSLKGRPLTATLIEKAHSTEIGGYAANMVLSRPAPEQALALSGTVGKVQPRAVQEADKSNPAFTQEIARLLREKGGIGVAHPHLMQCLRVDLNGDGREETLLAAEQRDPNGEGVGEAAEPEARAKAGKSPLYTIVALRYAGPGGVSQTIPLVINTFHKGGPDINDHYEVLTCADIDGDGKMEIVLYSRYYEGDGIQVYRFDGRQVKKVLEAGWGA